MKIVFPTKKNGKSPIWDSIMDSASDTVYDSIHFIAYASVLTFVWDAISVFIWDTFRDTIRASVIGWIKS